MSETVPVLGYHVKILTKSNLGKAPYASFLSLRDAERYAQDLSRPYDAAAADKGGFGFAAILMDESPTYPLHVYKDGRLVERDTSEENEAVAILSRHEAESEGYSVFESKGGKWNLTPAGRWRFATPDQTVSGDHYPSEATAWIAAARDLS
jgi:hypothetical protein